jgi:hypothetical protein
LKLPHKDFVPNGCHYRKHYPDSPPGTGTFIAWNDPDAVAKEVLDWNLPKLRIERDELTKRKAGPVNALTDSPSLHGPGVLPLNYSPVFPMAEWS